MRGDTDYLTTRDLATRWRLSTWTIRDYARRGLIDGMTRVGRAFRFATSATLRTAPSVTSSGRAVTTSDRRHTTFDDFDRQLKELRGRGG